jgi:uncharacterized protein DUF6600/FecR-like protein
MMAIPGAVSAQISDDQVPDQDSQQAPSVQGPTSQDPNDQGATQQGSNDQGSGNQSYDTPAPAETNGVARISLIHGDVSTQRGDSGNWSAAALNAPVLAGDRVSTGDRARTELQLDYANMFRLAEHSQADITTLTRSQIQIQLGRGMANYTVFRNSDADAEIDTPNVAIRTNRRESSFRILVTADDHTEVLVRRGEVEVTTPQGSTRVGQGQFIAVQGAGDQAQYKIGEAPARDDWDQWNTDRDNVIRNAVSRRRTNDYYVGAEDLDNHGTWTEVPDYGPVWRPTVAVGWAPYRDGRWVYEPYWGWTWVSYDPWGWAPYHYGRWMMYDDAWVWWPGPVYGYPYYRPIWAPAYVSFFGFGGGFGFGFGGGWGSIGWLPLGPCDRFHPWWGRWGGRFGDRDIRAFHSGGFAPLHGGTRFSNVNLALHDQHFRGGTTVSANEFGRGRMSARPMDHAAFQNARFSTGRLPVTPGRESFSASGRPAAPSTMRNVSRNQHFFSTGRTPVTTRGAFEGRQAQAPSNARQNSRFTPTPGNQRSTATEGDPRSGQPARNGLNSTANGREVARPGESGSNSGWRRFGQGQSSSPSSGFGNRDRAGNTSMAPRSKSPVNNNAPRRLGPPTPAPAERGAANPARDAEMRPGNQGNSTSARESNSEWRRFTPAPPRTAPQGSASRTPSRDSWRSPSRGSASESLRGFGRESRPPLNMRQPIVTPRSYGGGVYGGNRGGYSGGGRRSAPSYSGGGRSAPSYSGGHSAPSSHGGGSSHGDGGGGRHGR